MKPQSICLLLLLFFVAVLQGCEEKEEVYPEIQTLELTALSPLTATLKGEVITKGKIPVLDYGFIYGYSPNLDENYGTKASLGKDVKSGVYTKEVSILDIPSNYYYDRTLYARAYLRDEKGTVYGQINSVVLPSPNVQSILPTSGKVGDRITINGKFFTNDRSDVEVTFGGVAGNVVEVTDTKVVVEVPAGITTSYYYNYNEVPVVLRMVNQTFNVTSNFKITPTVKDFSPKVGTIGTVITILGDNLPSYSYSSYSQPLRVLLNQTEVSYTSYSTSIQVKVPATITDANVKVSVIANGVTTELPGSFTVTPHTVTSITPASGLPGSSISVSGSNFPSDSYYSSSSISAKVGDIPATVHYISANQLTVAVPQNMLPGTYKVSITAGPHTVEAPQLYQVLAPSITSFSPTSGGVGKQVEISGTFKYGTYYDVYFGSVRTSGYGSSANKILVNVPAGVDAGKVKIKVQHGDYLLEADDEFTVLTPTIVSFSPGSGVAGSQVTITLSGMSPDSYYTVVKFGTVATTILSVTQNSIRAVVPSGVTGAVKINVVHNGQTSCISSENFTAAN